MHNSNHCTVDTQDIVNSVGKHAYQSQRVNKQQKQQDAPQKDS